MRLFLLLLGYVIKKSEYIVYSGVNCHSVKNCFFVSIMPPRRKNKRTGGPVRNQQSRRQTRSGDSEVHRASTTTPPSKKRWVQPPLTRDNIPTIVQAICAPFYQLQPRNPRVPRTELRGLARQINDPHYQVALLWQDKNPLPSHIASHAFTKDVSQQVIHTPTFLYWNTTHSLPMNKNDINKTDVPLYSCECLNILIHCHNTLLDV